MPQADQLPRVTTPPPPDPPELPAGVDRTPRWPPWYAGVGFVVAIFGTSIAAAILIATGLDSDSPEFTVIGTLVQDSVFVGTALFFASFAAPPRPWHFGLRRTALWPAVGWAALGMFSFYLLAALYSAIASPDADQGITESLGADQSTLGLVVAGFMVVCVAPAAEEFFFRGFFYKALRSRFPIAAAALIDGLLFGLIHYSGSDTAILLPPLAILGVIFCLVYERTGSLFPVIAMHAFNNAVAYGVAVDDGWKVSVVVFPLVLGACVLAPRLTPRVRPAPPVVLAAE